MIATGGDLPELTLRVVVGQLEPTIVEEPRERFALAARVAERRAEHAALIFDAIVLDLNEREERVRVRAKMRYEAKRSVAVVDFSEFHDPARSSFDYAPASAAPSSTNLSSKRSRKLAGPQPQYGGCYYGGSERMIVD